MHEIKNNNVFFIDAFDDVKHSSKTIEFAYKNLLFYPFMRCAYVYDSEVSNFHYGKGHPMKPHRFALTNSLIRSYGLDKHLDVLTPHQTKSHLYSYHDPSYISSLSKISTSDDCPCFPGVDEYCERYSLNTILAAEALKDYTIAINWSGGLHHAKKDEASGFCYINDIVMGIQRLLLTNERVLYIDIDIHHGDGVEEAFYDNDRVMTLSLHKFGDNFFPGTGEIFSTGKAYTAVNVPLKSGIDDFSYAYVFEPIVETAIKRFNPDVIVMQCGADSLAGDRLGCFNLSIYGHGQCLKYVMKFNKKMLILGGGGYNIKNVSRCWAYETSVLCGIDVDNHIPEDNIYYDYFAPEHVLHPMLVGKFTNLNTRKYLDTVKGFVCENLNRIA